MTAEQNIWLRLLEKWADADDKKPPKKGQKPTPHRGSRDPLMTEHDDRCPTCNLAWWLFHPVIIAQPDDQPVKVRCVECKDVFSEPEWLREHRGTEDVK